MSKKIAKSLVESLINKGIDAAINKKFTVLKKDADPKANTPILGQWANPKSTSSYKVDVGLKGADLSFDKKIEAPYKELYNYKSNPTNTTKTETPKPTPNKDADSKEGLIEGLINKGIDKAKDAAENYKATIAQGNFQKGGAVWSKTNSSGLGTLKQEALGANVSGSYAIKAGLKGLEANVGVKAEANLYKASVSLNKGPVKASAEVAVGAALNANAKVTINPKDGIFQAEGGVDGFAGVRAKGEVTADLGVAKVGVHGDVGVGIGFKAKGKVGFNKGKFEAEFSIGAYLGIGGSFGIKISVDFGKILKGVKNVFKKLFGRKKKKKNRQQQPVIPHNKDALPNKLARPGAAAVAASSDFRNLISSFK